MKFGYTIIYVPSVEQSLAFFENAFGFVRRFVHESGDYGELHTGDTTLAFASLNMAKMHFPSGFIAAHDAENPLAFEVAFITDNINADHQKAIAAGAKELSAPEQKPWGQTVSYLRCPDGVVVELCSAME